MRTSKLFGSLVAVLICAACSGNPVGPSTTGKPTSTTTVTTPTPTPPTPTPTPGCSGCWSETFMGALSSRWTINQYTGINNTKFLRSNVDLSNGLKLTLTQDRNAEGSQLVLTGAEVQSVQRYGFGTYTWVFQGDPTGGSTSAMFVFYSNSTTEIDFEDAGGAPTVMHCVMFHNGHNVALQDAQVGDSLYTAFRTYSFTWTPTSIVWKVDGQTVATQTSDIPQEPGYIIMNHWGAGGALVWGGTPVYGTSSMTVQSFSFTPAQ